MNKKFIKYLRLLNRSVLLLTLCWSFNCFCKTEIELDEVRTLEQDQELAFSRIQISNFKGFEDNKIMQDFCVFLADELNQKSYWDAQCSLITRIGKAAEPVFGVDAILTGEWKSEDELWLSLKSKKMNMDLAKWSFKIPKPESNFFKPAAQMIVEQLVQKIEMLAFVIKSNPKEVLINLGSRKMARVGQSLKVFVYKDVNRPLNGPVEEIATVEIKEVLGPEKSIAVIKTFDFEHQKIPAFAQIKLDPKSIYKSQIEKRSGEKVWIALGGQLLNISTTVDNLQIVQKRNYNFNYTGFFDLSFGSEKSMIDIRYGTAASQNSDVTFMEIKGAYDFAQLMLNPEQAVIFSAGLDFGQYSSSNKSSKSLYQDTTRYWPLLDVRLQTESRAHFLFTSGLQFLYPGFVSDQNSGTQYFNYSLEPYFLMRYYLSTRHALEFGARFQYSSLNFSGNLGLRETQTGFILRAIYNFD